MTAEIAILNKSAVALATDSAVTISTGDREDKIYDSADKLFELSNVQPIAVMIYNGMSFTQIPLQSIIKQFRDVCGVFNSIQDAADAFLAYLHKVGKDAPANIQASELQVISRSFIDQIYDRFMRKLQEAFSRSREANLDEVSDQIADDIIVLLGRILSRATPGRFVGSKAPPRVSKGDRDVLSEAVASRLAIISEDRQRKIVELLVSWLKSSQMSYVRTGLVFAGFGSDEMFPTLISYEIDGMVFGRLKFIETNRCDIDRAGPRAAVIPFAQKEMVERFLYGLDDNIKKDISTFCKQTIPLIRKELLDGVDFESEDEKKDIENKVKETEARFLDGLSADAFDKIRLQSQREIEDMVEFMPKPEMATMAEALVNLTSIKRRVSRGMETVGGPIDVAVISQSEGFVWVKRKHYFPPELNQRQLERVRSKLARIGENENGPHRRQGGGIPPKKSAKTKPTIV